MDFGNRARAIQDSRKNGVGWVCLGDLLGMLFDDRKERVSILLKLTGQPCPQCQQPLTERTVVVFAEHNDGSVSIVHRRHHDHFPEDMNAIPVLNASHIKKLTEALRQPARQSVPTEAMEVVA